MRTLMLTAATLMACSGDEPSSDGPIGSTDTDTPFVDPFDYHSIQFEGEWTQVDIGGQRVDHYVPDNVKAMVWVFHGTDGNTDTVQFVEWLELYNDLLPHGFGFVMTSSQNRVDAQWDTLDTDPDTNPDWQYLLTVQDHLIANTAVTAATPVFSMGFSNGANYTVIFPIFAADAGMDCRGFVTHMGGLNYFGGHDVPGIWIPAKNDEITRPVPDYREAADECTANSGVECPVHVVTEIPLHPLRMAKMPYFTQGESEGVFDDLVSLEIVDEDGERLIDVEDIEREVARFESSVEYANKGWVDTQLRVVWATHRYNSMHRTEEVNWMRSRLLAR